MLYLIGNVEDLEKLNELVCLENQVKVVRLQDKVGKQNFHGDLKKVFEPMTNVIKNTSENITKTITGSSIINNKAIENSNEKVLELMNDKGMIARYLASSLVNFFKPANKSQFKLKKGQKSIRMNDFLINSGIPVSLYRHMLTFTDSNESFKLDGGLLETMKIYDLNVNHANPRNRKLIYEFGKEIKFDIKQKGGKSNRDKSMTNLLKSPAIMASGVSKPKLLSCDPDEFCDRFKLLLQKKQAGNNLDSINQEIVAIIDKLLEYNCISKKQHKQILIKCNLINFFTS